MQESIKEGLADIYLSQRKTEKIERGIPTLKKEIFILAIAFLMLSALGIFLIFVLNF